MDKQTPLRDNYVSCTEPTNPYHGNYVLISMTKPYCLNLPYNINYLWQAQTPGWKNVGAQSPGSFSYQPASWADMSRNFIMPTHCVRTWSNGSYWWNPDFYSRPPHDTLSPLSRFSNYPEPQIASTMYMQAHLSCLGYQLYLPYRYSENDSNVPEGDSYHVGFTESSRPYWNHPPNEYKYLNPSFQTSPFYDVCGNAGFNLTSYAVEIHPTYLVRPALVPGIDCPYSSFQVLLKPIVPYVDLSGCWLNPPTNYNNYKTYQDWDGRFSLETKYGNQQLSVLPAIRLDVRPACTSFTVVVPVQLYTMQPVGPNFTFTLQDVSSGAPAYGPNMEVVATTLRGTFWDANGEQTTGENAVSVHFEILSPSKLFNLSHTFIDNDGNRNRPFYCTETNSIPVIQPMQQFTSTLLLSPKCGPGMWTNLPTAP